MDGEILDEAPPHTDADAPDDIQPSRTPGYVPPPRTKWVPPETMRQPELKSKQSGVAKNLGVLFLCIAILLSLRLVVAVAHATFPADEDRDDVRPTLTYPPSYGVCEMNADKCPARVTEDVYDLGNAELYGP